MAIHNSLTYLDPGLRRDDVSFHASRLPNVTVTPTKVGVQTRLNGTIAFGKGEPDA